MNADTTHDIELTWDVTPHLEEVMALDAGATASAEVMGFPFSIKDTYYSETRPGRRTTWSFAGFAALVQLSLEGVEPLRQPVQFRFAIGLFVVKDLAQLRVQFLQVRFERRIVLLEIVGTIRPHFC